jgi:arylsulfatase A-like enzyme
MRKLKIILLLLCFVSLGLSPINSNRPNVVLIIIDTLRADKLGCYGFAENISPEIDALAKKGVQFKKVIAQCSWTRPSIGSMLTSHYPRSIGLFSDAAMDDILNDQYLTLAEILKANGYATCGITANPTINSIYNLNQGFDTYIDSDVVWKWMDQEEGKKVYQEGDTPLPDSAGVFKKTLDMAKSIAQRPAYMQILIMEVHQGWWLVRPEFKGKYAAHDFPWYLDGVRQSAYDTGNFIKELTSLPGWQNTLFIITADHGQGLNDHPAVADSEGHGNLLYESQLWVPLILYHSGGGLKNKEITRPVRLMDLMPTVLDYLNISLPDGIQGKSLLKLISDENADIGLPKLFVAETYFRKSKKIAVYSDKWKFIENRDNQEGVNRFELQPAGIKENGKITDKIQENPKISRAMKEFLAFWEQKYPKQKPIRLKHNRSEQELQQLKSLGYL